MASYRGHSDDDNPEVQGNSPPAGQRQRDNIGSMVVLLVLVILVDTVLQVLMLHIEFYYY